MLSKLTPNPPSLIFIDTLYHFQETLDLKDDVERRYNVPVHVYRPSGANTSEEFEALYGKRLWETNDAVYDYWAKVSFLASGVSFPTVTVTVTKCSVTHAPNMS